MATYIFERLDNGNVKMTKDGDPIYLNGDATVDPQGAFIRIVPIDAPPFSIIIAEDTITNNGAPLTGTADAIAEVLATTTFFKSSGGTVDDAITDGSANAVSSNAVFDALAAKASASALSTHISDTANPHSVTKSQVGLSNADNTSDAGKPVSTAQQTALDLKANAANAAFTGTHQITSNSDFVLRRATDANALIGPSIQNAGGAEVGVFKANMQTGEFKIGGTGSGFFTTLWSEAGEGARINAAGNFGVGTGATIDASAKFQVTSTTKGLLPPRMTTTQRDAIGTPAEGLQIYNLTTHTINFYNGTVWKAVTTD